MPRNEELIALDPYPKKVELSTPLPAFSSYPVPRGCMWRLGENRSTHARPPGGPTSYWNEKESIPKMRYPAVQVRSLLRQIEQGSIDLNHLAREINLDELRQLGREFLKQGDAWTVSVDLVRAELAVRRLNTRQKR